MSTMSSVCVLKKHKRCTSTLGIIALFVLVLFVFGHMMLHLVSSGITFRGLVDRIDWFHYSSLGVLNALPIMLFAFSCVIGSSTVTLHFYISCASFSPPFGLAPFT